MSRLARHEGQGGFGHRTFRESEKCCRKPAMFFRREREPNVNASEPAPDRNRWKDWLVDKALVGIMDDLWLEWEAKGWAERDGFDDRGDQCWRLTLAGQAGLDAERARA